MEKHKEPETIETKVCLAFKLDTSNYHMDQIESSIHVYKILSARYQFVQDSNRRKLPKSSTRELSKFPIIFSPQFFYYLYTIIYHNLSQAYRFYRSEIVPSVQLNTRKLPERTKQKRFYGLRWTVIENSAGFHSTTIEYGSWDEQVLSATWDIHVSRS